MAKLINDQAVQGDRYTQLHKTYQVILCNRMDIFKKLEEYYHEYHYMEIERHEDLPDNRSVIVFFELEKLNALEKKPVEEWSGLEKIGYMLKCSRDPEKRDIIKVLEEKRRLIKSLIELNVPIITIAQAADMSVEKLEQMDFKD